jgi:hypothetical protein
VDLLGQGDRSTGCSAVRSPSTAVRRWPGTLRYEIQIYQHAEHDGVRIFFFRTTATLGDDLRMTVRQGQAGFFTDDQLAHRGLPWDATQMAADDGPLAGACPGRRAQLRCR